MSFSIFTDKSFMYTLVHVEIDHAEKLIRRTFNGNLSTVSGEINPYRVSENEITECFKNEVKWLTELSGSKFIPELISINHELQQIVQRYYEPSLLLTGKRPTINEVIELYTFFKNNKVNKRNGSLSNMCFNGNQLVAFDFKHTEVRPEGESKEFKSYSEWLSKIDPALAQILLELYAS